MQKEKNQTVLERKQQMGHLITRCLVFILLERSIWGCSLAPKGTGTSIQSFKMAEIFEPATKFFTSRGRLEKQKQRNEYSNKTKNKSTGAIT